MQRLAELRPRWLTVSAQPFTLQARLLGLSGLLPAELTRSKSTADNYLRRIWDQWWRERDQYSDCILPREVWNFHGVRPSNHPQRRLALASHWPLNGELPIKLERWSTGELSNSALVSSLLEILQVQADDFWSWHCTFRSARFKKAQPLIGATRVTDLAVNVILPWLWARAAEDRNLALLNDIQRRYFAWPPAEDNSLLRLARERLLASAPRKALSGAATQQGLIQVVRDFCEHSNALCENCKLPELIRQWNAPGAFRQPVSPPEPKTRLARIIWKFGA
jgi:hypothetical protein